MRSILNDTRVQLDIDRSIATVTLNRPEKRNALDMPMFAAIARTIRQLKHDRAIRVIIVRANGEDFCTGLDIKSILHSRVNALKLLWKWLPGNANLAQQVSTGWKCIPVPVIMAIHGRCWGGGLQIALGGDFRIASPQARFSIMEGRWGLIPDMGGTAALGALLRLDDALKLAMSAKEIDAGQAKAMGLITQLADDPYQAAMSFADEIMEKSPDTLAAVKKLYTRAWRPRQRQLLARESLYQWRILLGRNRKIAVEKQRGDNNAHYRKRSRW